LAAIAAPPQLVPSPHQMGWVSAPPRQFEESPISRHVPNIRVRRDTRVLLTGTVRIFRQTAELTEWRRSNNGAKNAAAEVLSKHIPHVGSTLVEIVWFHPQFAKARPSNERCLACSEDMKNRNDASRRREHNRLSLSQAGNSFIGRPLEHENCWPFPFELSGSVPLNITGNDRPRLTVSSCTRRTRRPYEGTRPPQTSLVRAILSSAGGGQVKVWTDDLARAVAGPTTPRRLTKIVSKGTAAAMCSRTCTTSWVNGVL